MAMDGIIALALAKNYANKVSCGIASTSYDSATSTMTVYLNDGSSYEIVFDNGMTPQDREFLDNIKYDSTSGKLEFNGAEVLTKDNAATDDDIDSMFP